MRNLKNLCLQGLGVAALALGMSTAMAADKPSLKIGYVNGWDDSVAATHVAGEILRSKLGYSVELKPVEPAIQKETEAPRRALRRVAQPNQRRCALCTVPCFLATFSPSWIALMPNLAKTFARSARASVTSWSGKKSRLP